MRVQFKWYDLWIGMYFDTQRKLLYICIIPTIVFVFKYLYCKWNIQKIAKAIRED